MIDMIMAQSLCDQGCLVMPSRAVGAGIHFQQADNIRRNCLNKRGDLVKIAVRPAQIATPRKVELPAMPRAITQIVETSILHAAHKN
ncbi:MAG: hypothetical protein GX413_13605 [Acetobacter sp.]|nr:hypothetical protein [Acetobacter sp.]